MPTRFFIMVTCLMISYNHSFSQKKIRVLDDDLHEIPCNVFLNNAITHQDINLGPRDNEGFFSIPQCTNNGDIIKIVPANIALFPIHTKYCSQILSIVKVSRHSTIVLLENRVHRYVSNKRYTSALLYSKELTYRKSFIENSNFIDNEFQSYQLASKLLLKDNYDSLSVIRVGDSIIVSDIFRDAIIKAQKENSLSKQNGKVTYELVNLLAEQKGVQLKLK